MSLTSAVFSMSFDLQTFVLDFGLQGPRWESGPGMPWPMATGFTVDAATSVRPRSKGPVTRPRRFGRFPLRGPGRTAPLIESSDMKARVRPLSPRLSRLHFNSCVLEVAPHGPRSTNCSPKVAPQRLHPIGCAPEAARQLSHPHQLQAVVCAPRGGFHKLRPIRGDP